MKDALGRLAVSALAPLALLLALLVVAPCALAADTVISSTCASVTAFDYAGQEECRLGSQVNTANRLFSDQVPLLVDQILKATRGADLDITKAQEYFGIFQYLFWGLLILVSMLTGYQFMMASEDPAKRLEAKRTFKFIIASGILVAALPLIIEETDSFSKAFSDLALQKSGLGGGDPFNLPAYVDASSAGLSQDVNRLSTLTSNVPVFSVASLSYVISMNARHVLVLLIIAISPIVLLMFAFSPTKEFGRLLAYLFGLELVLPGLNAIILHFSIMLSGAEIDMLLLSAALFVSVAFHLLLALSVTIKASTSIIQHIRLEAK